MATKRAVLSGDDLLLYRSAIPYHTTYGLVAELPNTDDAFWFQVTSWLLDLDSKDQCGNCRGGGLGRFNPHLMSSAPLVALVCLSWGSDAC